MSNSEAGGNESSSSNPIPPPPTVEEREFGLPHGRGSSPMHPWEMALFSPPPPRAPPIMGAPGRTAFGPYRPPPPPPPGPGRPLGGGGVRIGGSPSSGRKRGREGNRAVEGGVGGQQHCSVCNKGFGSSKALFGHMRSHPDRGWKGVHPPPAFRAEEEFADLHVAEAEAEAEAEGDGVNFKVPDLNHPPPPDSK